MDRYQIEICRLAANLGLNVFYEELDDSFELWKDGKIGSYAISLLKRHLSKQTSSAVGKDTVSWPNSTLPSWASKIWERSMAIPFPLVRPAEKLGSNGFQLFIDASHAHCPICT